MLLCAWYFVTVILTALLMGTSFAHTLEMPPKMTVDGVLWMTFQHTLYPYFAYAGAPVELGSIIGAAGLSFLLRGKHPGFYHALVATICLATAFFVVWLIFTNAVNAETAKWTADSIPADWAKWRRQWEYSHAIRFVLHLRGFASLLLHWSLCYGTVREKMRVVYKGNCENENLSAERSVWPGQSRLLLGVVKNNA